MSSKECEPGSWRYYDDSSLPTFLRHDTWDALTAIALLCEIDPKHSDLFDPRIYYNTDLVEEIMYDDTQPYWKIKLLSDYKKEHIPKCWYASVDDFQDASGNWDKNWEQWPDNPDPYISLDNKIAPQFAAQRHYVEVREIFFSSPDHKDNPTRDPKYFVHWALSKGLEIKWLQWAEVRGYIDDSNQAATADSPDLDKRERDTLDALVGGLLHALKIDPSEHGVIKKIEGLTEDYGAPIRKTAISKILKRIQTAKESVQDRKSR